MLEIDKLEHSEERKLQLLMNSKAIENAKANAVSFTKPLGQTVGKAIYVGNIFEGVAKKTIQAQL